MTIGERIKKARKQAGLTQSELGERLDVSAAMISQYETGSRTPKLTTLHKIAKALHTTTDCMIGWSDSPTHDKKTVVDVEFQALLDSLGYSIHCYGDGEKINLIKLDVGGGPITLCEYQQLKENIYSYIRYNADKLSEIAANREFERIDEELEKMNTFLNDQNADK